MMNRLSRCSRILGLGISLSVAAGCGNKLPYDFVPVHGTVTYEDGSLIDAEVLMVAFEPTDFEREEGKVPPSGQTEADVGSGIFHSVSSYRPNDGLAVGKHRVLVAAFSQAKNGRRIPSPAVPKRYSRAETTPIEVEISESDQELEIKVARP